MNLPYTLERTILIAATRQTVFRFFEDSDRFAAWWGPGSTIEARVGGAVVIRYPNGVMARGEVIEVVPGERIVFTYGYEDPAKPIPPGGSRVTITLSTRPTGTLLELRHDLPTEAARDQHVPGWRYQLAVFANAVAREQHAGVDQLADRWFAAWAESDAARRRALLGEAADESVTFRDAFGCTSGLAELDGHIGAVQQHMPGVTMSREGPAKQCQGTALVEWTAKAPDGAVRARGTSVFTLTPQGRISHAVGFWG